MTAPGVRLLPALFVETQDQDRVGDVPETYLFHASEVRRQSDRQEHHPIIRQPPVPSPGE